MGAHTSAGMLLRFDADARSCSTSPGAHAATEHGRSFKRLNMFLVDSGVPWPGGAWSGIMEN